MSILVLFSTFPKCHTYWCYLILKLLFKLFLHMYLVELSVTRHFYLTTFRDKVGTHVTLLGYHGDCHLPWLLAGAWHHQSTPLIILNTMSFFLPYYKIYLAYTSNVNLTHNVFVHFKALAKQCFNCPIIKQWVLWASTLSHLLK